MAFDICQAIFLAIEGGKMNANFGIILRKSMIETLLVSSAPIVRSWGGIKEENSEKKYTFPSLANIEFQLYPLTEFIQSHIPLPLKDQELTFAWMNGQGIDEYEEWIRNSELTTAEKHPFETGLLEIIHEAHGATIMFAPEGERLGDFFIVEPTIAINLLRLSVKHLEDSKGFMATIVNGTSPS